MAQNLATKYSAVLDEKFTRASITDIAVNNDYEWAGVKTVNVYSIDTVALGNYSRTGLARYGTASDLDNNVQTLTLSQDKAFTFVIDRGNFVDSQMTMQCGKALSREIEEVVVPTIDTYRLGVMVAGAGNSATATITKTKANAYETFLDGCEKLNEKKVPLVGRVAFISGNFYKQIRLDPNFIKASDIAQDMLLKGSVGMVEGVQLIYAGGYLASTVEFVITHPSATVSPKKLQSYYIHENPQGVDGWVCEGRNYYDAFVLDNKKDAIYVHKNA